MRENNKMTEKIETQTNYKKGNITACLLNALIYPGFGELSIGHTYDGRKWIIYYTIWSVIALVATLLSVGIMLPLVFIIDTIIRIYSGYTVYFMTPIEKKVKTLEARG